MLAGQGDVSSSLAASSRNPASRGGVHMTGPGTLLRQTPMYRISQDGQEPIIDVHQVEAIEPAIRSSAARSLPRGWDQPRSAA